MNTNSTEATKDICWVMYHAGERDGELRVSFCLKLESEHPACGHDFRARYNYKCACGETHDISEFPKWEIR
jgi:hypothetical protein